MGMLWDLIQRHIDRQPYPPSERQVAAKLGVAPNALRYWREPKKLPSRENLQAIADLVGVRYAVVLDAALRDTGYHESSPATVVHMRPRAITTIEAELQAAKATLADWRSLKLTGPDAESKRAELAADVDALEAELVASRRAIGGTESVAGS
jgi:transcriptional regulator with XRE-family HTH domain